MTVLFILALIFAIIGWTKKSSVESANKELEAQVDSLEDQKDELMAEVESLMSQLETVATENESLQGSIADAERLLAEKEAMIAKMKKNASDSQALKNDIASLKSLKGELENTLNNLRMENEALMAENQRLTGEVALAQEENATLAGRLDELEVNKVELQQRVSDLANSSFKATSFEVSVEGKKDKAVVKGKKARTINISFDLDNVPSELQGSQTLYMVMSDEQGTPVKVDNPIKARIQTPKNEILEIEAQQAKEVTIRNSQRLDFTHEVTEKMRPGLYKAVIYGKTGLVGAVSFRLG